MCGRGDRMTDCGGATEEAYLGQGVARSHGRQSESETYDLRHHGGFGWVVGVGVVWLEDIVYQVYILWHVKKIVRHRIALRHQ